MRFSAVGGFLQRQQGAGEAPDLPPGTGPEYVGHGEVPSGAEERPGGAGWGQRLGRRWLEGGDFDEKKPGDFRGKHGEIAAENGEFEPKKWDFKIFYLEKFGFYSEETSENFLPR